MRTLVDIPEEDIALLNRLSAEEGVSRAELVRRAIAVSLAPHKQEDKAALRAAFGLWKDMKEDGLAYQERLREEWEERYSIQTS